MVTLATERVTPDVHGVLVEWRCRRCKRLFLRYLPLLHCPYMELRCPRCDLLNILMADTDGVDHMTER